MKNIYLIKQVSDMTGLTSSNIRYYEKEGLITNISRDKNAIRQYTDSDVIWIDFLSKLKNMEMPIHEMKQYANLREKGNSTIQERKELLLNHKKHLEKKQKHIQNNMSLLDEKIEIYREMERKNEK